MAKKIMKKTTSSRNKSVKRPANGLQEFVASLKKSPKKAVFVISFALVSVFFVLSVVAASLCAPKTTNGGSGTGRDGAAGADSTCIASASNNYCSGTSGSDSTGTPGTPGSGSPSTSSPGTPGSAGSPSAPGQPGTPSAPSAPSAPSGPATGTICTTRNGVKTCQNL